MRVFLRKKYVFLQPALPDYRVSFFEYLSEKSKNHDIYVYASKVEPGGVVSVDSLACVKKYVANLSVKKLPMIHAYWQSLPYSEMFKLGKGDFLIINGNPRYLSNFICFLIAKLLRVKIIWWGQAWSSTSTLRNMKIRIFLARFFDGVLLYTEKEVDKFVMLGFPKDKVVGVNNGVDVDGIRKYKLPAKPKKNIKKLLFIGRITKKAKLDLLFDALSLIEPASRPKLVVIGDGPEEAYCRQLQGELLLSDTVTWLGAIRNQEKVAGIMSDCDIFVYPGSVGLSLINAFALGLPAIVHSTDSLHMPEIAAFKNNYNGMSFNFGDSQSLSEIIKCFIDDEYALSQYSKNAYATVTDTYNTKDMADRFLHLVNN